ncbi:MAG: phosphoenolpyruvate carboxylase [Synergistetes bacterium]|nr:phosphoenolpyruvate carboxylase [Synergistota bacterium]MDW8193167.1 phosphoenolpyruvate carboxylase [Synergistota bacterium]
MKIPRCMSTQHPDNVISPFFTNNAILGGEDEIEEAFYVFSHLGCDEQMWDYEGKEVDNFVVKKLLTKYESFFKEKPLGKEVFITLRVPNPAIEKEEAKILLETLESIPRSYDVAKLFYGDDIAPIFEVILPMTTSADELNSIYYYYSDFVTGKQKRIIEKTKITIGDWIGEFKPEKINVIPLFENKESMLNAHEVVRSYLEDKDIPYQRVFLARSDPAMNYGIVSAVIFNKIALSKLHKLSIEIGKEIYPIIGVGSAPFRGNLRPQTVERVLEEYPSVYTFTIQSSFKYDNTPEEARKGIKRIKKTVPRPPQEIDENKALEIAERYSREYQSWIVKLAPLINKVAKYVPQRRKRKLHIGLFGYSRKLGDVSLPRAIAFTAALYSVGLPPEVFALNSLTKEDLNFLKDVYIGFKCDIKDALKFSNVNGKLFPKELKEAIEKLEIEFEEDEEHKELTEFIVKRLEEGKTEDLEKYILRAAHIRKFLG